MKDPTDLHQQEIDAEATRLRQDLERKQEAEDFKWLMAHKAGRRLVRGWLKTYGVRRTPFNHSGSITAFNCGLQNAGLMLEAQILEHAPDAYLGLLKEHKE